MNMQNKFSRIIQSFGNFLLLASLLLLTREFFGKQWAGVFLVIVIAPQIVNLLISGYTWSVPILVHPVNIFTTKFVTDRNIELAPDLAFWKFKEAMQNANYTLLKEDSQNHILYAKPPLTWFGGRERIYVVLEPNSDGSTLHFTSITLSTMDFFKNRKNMHTLLDNYEESLII